MFALTIYVGLVVILVGIRKFQQSKWLKCLNNVKLTNKVAIVTGANSGIGYEIVKELVKRQAEVVLACRNLQAANASIKAIKQNYPEAKLVPLELDLTSLQSVKHFIQEINRRYQNIDILVNNAGIYYPSTNNLKTSDGIEIHFGVNHLSHFYLTTKLLPRLENTENSRVIIMTSKLLEKGKINFNDLNCENLDQGVNLYANSKLANAYFCKELSKRTKVNVYACCPGWVYTNLFKNHTISWYKYIFILPVAFLFMRSPRQGAQTPLFCATEPSLLSESGNIYRDCQKYKPKIDFDEQISQDLWEKSEQLIKIKIINN